MNDYTTHHHAKNTSLTVYLPWSMNAHARILCSDGRVRKTKRMSVVADSLFSIPASVSVKGKTVTGYITKDYDGALEFRATGKNKDLLP